jgi:uncharacterized protein (TIGR00369 family)
VSADEAIPAPPEGFAPMVRRGEFSLRNGPYFSRPREGGVEQAFFALARHCNGIGIVHGGMLASFMDSILAHAVGQASGRPSVTIHLSIDYLAMARAGEWVFGEAQATRVTREVAFAEARIHAAGHDVVRGSGLFKLMHRRG